MGALDALAGELACANATDAQINEIRALHYEMLAYHARGDLAGYFKFNQAIHLKIVKYSGNAVLYNTYRQLNGAVQRARYMANLSKERWDAAVREHDEILAALGARDVKRIRALLSDHLAHKLASVLAALPRAAQRRRERAVLSGQGGGGEAGRFRARGAPAPGSRRRSTVRCRLARPLLDRRVDLPDRADRRRRAAQRGSRARGDRDRRRAGRAGPAARRRQLAVRPDGRRRAGHRRFEIPATS